MAQKIPKNLADAGVRWRLKPSTMVRELFGAEPDPWQEEALDAYPSNPRLAMKSAKGPGKSTTLAWIGWNFLLTRPHPKGVATSISGGNLRDGLWSELAKWMHKAPLLKHMFEFTTTRIFAKEHPNTWFLSARTWPQKAEASAQAETLAGIHADYVIVLIDESGAMPDAIMPTVEAVLAGCIEGHVVQAGNPIQTSGPLYRACKIARNLWHVVEVTGDPDNPKRSNRIPIQLAREQIEQYGRSNPWVIVNIFGDFPAQSLNALIGPEEVREAMKRHYRDYEIGRMPRIMAADVARFGDDASFIAKRQGIQMFPGIKKRNLTSDEGASLINREWSAWGADACFIDATGGFGSGWIDQLRLLGRTAYGVQFAGKAHQNEKYSNKRTEMALDFVEWIRRGGALNESDELLRSLTETTYTFSESDGRMILEPKTLIKAKLGFSPDEMDAEMMTFAEEINTTAAVQRIPNRSAVGAYDAFREVSGGNSMRDYDPFKLDY